MTEDLVFRLLPEKREAFLDHIEKIRTDNTLIFNPEYTAIREALIEAAFFFYHHIPKEEVFDRRLDIFLEKGDAQALTEGINRLWRGILTKKPTGYQQALYYKIVQYAIASGFGELITEEQLARQQAQDFLDFTVRREQEPKPVKKKTFKHQGRKFLDEEKPSQLHVPSYL